MKELILRDGDGGEILLSDNLSHIRTALRWLASRGDQQLEALCAPLAEECRLEEKALLKQSRTVVRVQKAREGERVHGEAVVVLQTSENCPLTYGDELSLTEVDNTFRFKYPASGLALQRAKKAGRVVGIHFKERAPAAPQVDSAGNIYEEDQEPSKEFHFCRVSDISLVAPQYPAAAERYFMKLENEKHAAYLKTLTPAARDAFLAKELAEHRAKLEAERAVREAKEEAQAAAAKIVEDAEAAEQARLEEEAELAAVAERSAKKRTERLRAAEREQQAAGESIVQQPNEKENQI